MLSPLSSSFYSSDSTVAYQETTTRNVQRRSHWIVPRGVPQHNSGPISKIFCRRSPLQKGSKSEKIASVARKGALFSNLHSGSVSAWTPDPEDPLQALHRPPDSRFAFLSHHDPIEPQLHVHWLPAAASHISAEDWWSRMHSGVTWTLA